MKKSQARGYLLEIVISKLIENNGYNVIRREDGKEIIRKYNGLNVKGRGGYHQFDTLGQFRITPPFVYPIRLFVEAKFYESEKVGIDRVRMGVGVLDDVNTNYSTVEIEEHQLSTEKFQYHYAIFSTSGFTKAAQRYAIAHKIHLIDLSGSEYYKTIYFINCIVDELDEIFSDGNDCIPKDEFDLFKRLFCDAILKRTNRNYILNMLHKRYSHILSTLIKELYEYINSQYLYLANINGPYIIPLLSNHDFHKLLNEKPHQEVYLTWNREYPNNWIITSSQNDSMHIMFTLPDLLTELLLLDKNTIDNAALGIKEQTISKFTFITFFDDNPTLCTLKYNKEETDRYLKRQNRNI